MPALPSYLTSDLLADLVRRALAEDVGAGDATTNATVGAETRAHAVLMAKESGILAGTTVAEEVFRQLDRNLAVRWERTDGDAVTRGDHVAEIEGPARTLLTGERTALNLLQRMSGIATATRAMVDAVRPHPARILDTRKTAPGLRLLDKWAVRIGGGQNHRIGLFDMILIKENHIVAAGGIRPALQAVNDWKASNRPIPVEIETQTLDADRFRLADLRGKVVVLNVWATWCPPCVVETPGFVGLQDDFAGEVQFVGLSTDDNLDDVRAFATKYEVNYPLLVGRNYAGDGYHVPMLPTTFLIDRDGHIRFHHEGLLLAHALRPALRALVRE